MKCTRLILAASICALFGFVSYAQVPSTRLAPLNIADGDELVFTESSTVIIEVDLLKGSAESALSQYFASAKQTHSQSVVRSIKWTRPAFF